MWDSYNRSTKDFVHEVMWNLKSEAATQARIGELHKKAVSLGTTAPFSIKHIPKLLKAVLFLVKMIARNLVSGTIDVLQVIAKIVKVLNILGYVIGPIIDVVICILQIKNKRKSYKKGEIGKKEFIKFPVQKVAELVTNLFFAVLTPFVLYYLWVPVVGLLVPFIIPLIAWAASKLVGWLAGKAAGFLLDKFITE